VRAVAVRPGHWAICSGREPSARTGLMPINSRSKAFMPIACNAPDH
jgi:hypothetical protein